MSLKRHVPCSGWWEKTPSLMERWRRRTGDVVRRTNRHCRRGWGVARSWDHYLPTDGQCHTEYPQVCPSLCAVPFTVVPRLHDDNGQQLHSQACMHAHTHTHTHSREPPSSPLAFLFGREYKYPHNRKRPALDAFSTVHCFNYMYLLTSLNLFSACRSPICFEW